MDVTELVREAPPPAVATRGRVVEGLVRTARPRQWIKNSLVAAAPLAAARGDAATLTATGLAFVAFCLASVAVYFLNDAADVHEDRAHPRKRRRPVAAGLVPVPLAWTVSGCCGAAALAVACAVRPLLPVVGIYLLCNLGYCRGLKHLATVELALVSSGFLLRAMAGGIAAGLALSPWFLLVAGFGSLYVVAGKRYSELVTLGDEAVRARRSLAAYSVSYLRFVWSLAAGVVLVTYCLWAFEVSRTAHGALPWTLLSVVPFTFILLSYARDIDAGTAGEPEEVVLGSPVLPLLGIGWAVLFGLGAVHA